MIFMFSDPKYPRLIKLSSSEKYWNIPGDDPGNQDAPSTRYIEAYRANIMAKANDAILKAQSLFE